MDYQNSLYLGKNNAVHNTMNTQRRENEVTISTAVLTSMPSAASGRTTLISRLAIEMCAGQNLLERERKETRSRLKNIFLFPGFFLFFSFLERVFFLFLIFLWISRPVFRCSFPVLSSFH